jgi:hypothetical protein
MSEQIQSRRAVDALRLLVVPENAVMVNFRLAPLVAGRASSDLTRVKLTATTAKAAAGRGRDRRAQAQGLTDDSGA